MSKIIDIIESANFLATAEHVERLAAMRQEGYSQSESASGTYLRVLIAQAKSRLSRKVDAEQAIELVHAELYPAIIRGVTTPELAELEAGARKLEINRRAGFARTAASTLRSYVKLGGALKTLDIPTVTKFQLYRATKPPEPRERLARQVVRGERVVVNALRRMAKSDPDQAESEIERFMRELKELLDTLNGSPQPTVPDVQIRSHSLRKVKRPEAHASI